MALLLRAEVLHLYGLIKRKSRDERGFFSAEADQ